MKLVNRSLVIVVLGCVVTASVVLWRGHVLEKIDDVHSTRGFVSEHPYDTPLKTFRMHVGRYPLTNEGLKALKYPPEGIEDLWQGPYMLRLPYSEEEATAYTSDGDTYELRIEGLTFYGE